MSCSCSWLQGVWGHSCPVPSVPLARLAGPLCPSGVLCVLSCRVSCPPVPCAVCLTAACVGLARQGSLWTLNCHLSGVGDLQAEQFSSLELPQDLADAERSEKETLVAWDSWQDLVLGVGVLSPLPGMLSHTC